MGRTRELIVVPTLVALAAVAWFLLETRSEGGAAEARIRHEDAALELVRRLVAAQERHHAAQGRYGWLEDLRAAGMLDGVPTRTEGTDLVAATPGYRIDVLLPATSSASQVVALGARAEERLNERLARKHFAVVARPWDDDTSAWRTWYLDERGRIFVNEGVSDPLTRERPPLPSMRPADHGGVDPAGLRWWPLDDLPER